MTFNKISYRTNKMTLLNQLHCIFLRMAGISVAGFFLLAAGLASAAVVQSISNEDTSNATGTWHLNANGFRIEAVINNITNAFSGTIISEDRTDVLNNIFWNPATRTLEFRRSGPGFWQWYRAKIVEGVLVGRFSHSNSSPEKPTQLTDYRYHVTGWNIVHLDSDIVPRVFELTTNNVYLARLRLDRASDGATTGRLKVYSSPYGEELEYDVEVTQWDGTNLSFIRHAPNFVQVYSGIVQGRTISGTFMHNGTGSYPWNGSRAEVLTFGLSEKSPEDRAVWQARTRRTLQHLMMAGNPSPISRTVTKLRTNVIPSNASIAQLPPDRDDNPAAWPQSYTMTELGFTYTLPNPYNLGNTITRNSHAYLAVPNQATSGSKLPAVLALNGHTGSAWQVMSANNRLFWYGDSFARRGYVVLAVDISHRNDSPLYHDWFANGDDPANGNGPHPSIKAAGFDTDWEENGERAWDVMRALDYLLTLPNVDPQRILVTGLSMGGEMTTTVAALDPRIAIAIAAGFSADLGVLKYHGNHPCWQWVYGDIREYIDVSDLHALIAPRPFMVQTGIEDYTFSDLHPPYSADKQVERRARSAYADIPQNYVHYLHYDEHHFHAGSVNPTHNTEAGIWRPTVTGPETPWSLTWQTDSTRDLIMPTLFDFIGSSMK